MQNNGFKSNDGYIDNKPKTYQIKNNTENNQPSEKNQKHQNRKFMEITYAGHDDYGNEQY